MRNISKELFLFLDYLNLKINEESKNIYDNFLNSLLQEDSHSFGFKPFAELSEYIINEIAEIYENEIVFDFYYESLISCTYFDIENIKFNNSEDFFHFINLLLITNPKENIDYQIEKNDTYNKIVSLKYIDKTEELINVIVQIIFKLREIEINIAKKINIFLDIGQQKPNFLPVRNIELFLLDYMDYFPLRIENNWTLLDEEEISNLINQGNGLFKNYILKDIYKIKTFNEYFKEQKNE